MEHEKELIRSIADGGTELFEQIVLQYQNLIYTVCLNITDDIQDAENMAQETFITAFRSLPNFRGENLKAWLCRIAVNKSIDFKRRSSRLIVVEDASPYYPEADNAPEHLLAQIETKERLERILSALPDKYSSVIREFYYHGLSVKEISLKHNIPEKTIETQLYRAKKLIKERWGDYEI